MNFWSAQYARRITERIVVETDLVLQTPAHFGNGDGDEIIDMPLLVDPLDGKSPLLTGASIAGALRGYLLTIASGYGDAKETRFVTDLFGSSKGDEGGEQSPLVIDDALGTSKGVELRDGVKINAQSRTAEHNALFNLEAWQAGTSFPLRFELVIRGADEERKLKQALATALHGFETGEITLGARKRRGYGQVAIKDGWRVQRYDLTTPEGLIAWLECGQEQLASNGTSNIFDALGVSPDAHSDARCYFDMKATFRLDGALLIRSGSGQDGPDAVHLHARQPDQEIAPVVPGTSWAGALRARALKICKTLDLNGSIVEGVFGTTEKASRVSVRETVVKEPANTKLVQNRVSIDRFTGGALDTALFNEQPVFSGENTKLTLELRLTNPAKHEVGLLLSLLKDLWTSDLPIGGTSSIGRGRLKGKEAHMTLKNGGDAMQHWRIVQGSNGLSIDGDQEALESFVEELATGEHHEAAD